MEEGPLVSLPPELIVAIAGNLAVPDFVWLAKTSRRMFDVLRSGYPLIKSPRTMARNPTELLTILVVAEHRNIMYEGPQPICLKRLACRDVDGSIQFLGRVVDDDHSRNEQIIAFGTVVYVKRRPGPPVFDYKTSTLTVEKGAKIAWNNILVVVTYSPQQKKLTWFVWRDPLKPPTVESVDKDLCRSMNCWEPQIVNDLSLSVIKTDQKPPDYWIYNGFDYGPTTSPMYFIRSRNNSAEYRTYFISRYGRAERHHFRDIKAASCGNCVCATCSDGWAIMVTTSHTLIGDMTRAVPTQVLKFTRHFDRKNDRLILRNDGLMLLNKNGRLREWWVFARA